MIVIDSPPPDYGEDSNDYRQDPREIPGSEQQQQQSDQFRQAQRFQQQQQQSGDYDMSDDVSMSLPHATPSSGYNANDYAHLNVNKEVKELFHYIEQFKPQEVNLDTKLKCFLPEFVPCIGEIDTFIKVPRPDGKADGLGLSQLDEPATIQTDSTVLELQLRAISKKKNMDPITVYLLFIIIK